MHIPILIQNSIQMKNVIALLLLSCIFGGCASKHKPVVQKDSSIIPENLVFSQEQKLSSHPVNLNFMLNDPMQLIMVDSLLLIGDFGESLVKVVDPVSGRKLNSICRKGRGPGEFSERIKIAYNKRDNAINIYEVEVKTLAQFPMSQVLKWENDSVKKIHIDKPFIQQAIKCNDSLLVGVGMLEKRYALFNSEGKFVGIINMPTYPVNCAFGGPEMQTLYITSYNKIYSIQTNVKGHSF